MKCTLEFLESFEYGYSYHGNINRISKDVYKFTVYNFLPGTDPHGLDGHYSFAVNVTNFEYVYWKDSGYGGLTWTVDNEDKVFLRVHKSIREQIEIIIATKLRGAYFYDSNAVNNYGKNLFSDGTPPEPAGSGFNENIVRYRDGQKISLICTWVEDYPGEPLGELKEIEKLAIKKLQK